MISIDANIPGCSHFKWKEILRSNYINGYMEPNEFQQYCYTELLTMLEYRFRAFFGPLIITSGLRTNAIVTSLRAAGYPASKTSDHLCWFNYETKEVRSGAVDFYPKILRKDIGDMWRCFEFGYRLYKKRIIKIHQWIFYPENMNSKGEPAPFFHISNSRQIAFWQATNKSGRILVYANKKYQAYHPGITDLEFYRKEGYEKDS